MLASSEISELLIPLVNQVGEVDYDFLCTSGINFRVGSIGSSALEYFQLHIAFDC